jgi:membrane-bound lytic murein transglycosylase A
MRFIFSVSVMAVLLSSCSLIRGEQPMTPVLQLDPVAYHDIAGWESDHQVASLRTFAVSCRRILKTDSEKSFGGQSWSGRYADWQEPCQHLPDLEVVDDAGARAFFEEWFSPYVASNQGDETGLFTGYYEPSLQGSDVQTGLYQTPLRARPDDLVMVNLGEFLPDFKGKRIAGRVSDGYLKPYDDRTAIESGKLPAAMDKPLYWVDSAVDAFFLQVQGSGVITLPDGSTQRIGYDGQNGYPYTAIGKELIARGALTKDNVSMQSIRAWLAAHPEEAIEVMRVNKSYVFFKKLDTAGPVGAEGVVLTPERSLAVDHALWPYGMPLFMDADGPEEHDKKLQQLMIAQDTGGAITGVVRGDFFWGYGATAAHHAGVMRSRGILWALLPKSVKPQPTE